MKTLFLRGVGVFALLTVLVWTMSAQGMYWESTTSVTGMEQLNKTYYMPKMFKNIGGRVGSNQEIIFRLDREVLYEIHPDQKTYSELTFAQLEAVMKNLGGQMEEKMAEVKKQMENMPAEQRKMMEEMLGSQMGMAAGNMEVTKIGQTQKLSGFVCAKYVITQGGKEVATIWSTTEVKEFEAMRSDFNEFTKRLAFNKMASAMADAMKKVEGFPIQIETQGLKQMVTKVERRTVTAGEFEVPAGFTKVESEFMRGR